MERVHPKNGAMPPGVLVHKRAATRMETASMLCIRQQSSAFDGLRVWNETKIKKVWDAVSVRRRQLSELIGRLIESYQTIAAALDFQVKRM